MEIVRLFKTKTIKVTVLRFVPGSPTTFQQNPSAANAAHQQLIKFDLFFILQSRLIMATRQPLAQVSENIAMTRRQQSSKVKAAKEEKDVLKAQIADLTAQLEKSKLEPTVSSTPAQEIKNPFGGHVPAASTYTSLSIAHPKRAATAFQLFCKDTRQQIKDEYPDASMPDVNAKLGEMWKKCDEGVRREYEAAVETDRKRYEAEMSVYNEQKNQMETEKKAIEFYSQAIKQQKAMEFYEAHLAKQKAAPSGKKGIEAPKQPRSSYNFYVSLRHKELAEEEVSIGEANKKISEEWKKLQTSKTKKNKAKLAQIHEMVAEDEIRFENESKEYEARRAELEAAEANEYEEFRKAALSAYNDKMEAESNAKAFRIMQSEIKEAEKLERKKVREEKKAAKAAKADEPKRPKNAYTVFFTKNAALVTQYLKENDIDHSMAKEIGDRWKALGDRERRPYEKEAEADRIRYQREMAAYSAKAQ